jgi:hypothetical protein
MKLRCAAVALLFFLFCQIHASKKSELFVSKYFSFQSSQLLNAHLFLYQKALDFNAAAIADEALAIHLLRGQTGDLSQKDLLLINSIVRFYKDSLISKDLLNDSVMRHFEDYLAIAGCAKLKGKNSWQHTANEQIKLFQPFFAKFFWPAIDSANKVWLNTNKVQIKSLENALVPELEKIYKVKLPNEKIRVDLTCFATLSSGAFSFKDSFSHIVFCSSFTGNQGLESIFRQTSYFLIDKLKRQITLLVKNKGNDKLPELCQHIVLYTTGFLLEKQYKLKWEKFEPAYEKMTLNNRKPAFNNAIEGCKIFWTPYINGQVSFDLALNNLATYVLQKNKFVY